MGGRVVGLTAARHPCGPPGGGARRQRAQNYCDSAFAQAVFCGAVHLSATIFAAAARLRALIGSVVSWLASARMVVASILLGLQMKSSDKIAKSRASPGALSDAILFTR